MKRVELISKWGEFQPTAVVEVEDEVAQKLLQRRQGKLTIQQHVYTHIDEMPPGVQKKAIDALEAAEKAGGPRDQQARALATAPWRDK